MRDLLLDPKFEAAADRFARACAASREHAALAAAALAKHGEHGPAVSGCVRDHFPQDVKDELRFLAAQVSRWSRLAWDCRPPRIRSATMRRLAQQVATRDGAGFYGPQPIRWKA